MTDNKKSKTYKASLALQQKVGKGPLDEKLILKAQKAIDENKVDFTPLGLQFLEKLKENLNSVEKDNSLSFEEQKQSLTRPVMELKANATIFHYSLIGNLANIMLNFLESIQEFDKDALSIVSAHHTTLHAIILKKMAGDGGVHGEIFISELKDACARYFTKKKKEKQAKE